MEIITNIEKFNPISASIITIGSYDGIHRGHITVIKEVVREAKKNNLKSVLITFDPHPRHIIDRKNKLSLLMGINQKIDILKTFDLDYLCIIKFDTKFSKITPEKFLSSQLIPIFNPKYFVIGYNHHFGFRRKGNADFLFKYFSDTDVHVKIVKPISNSSNDISSTSIRKLILQGKIKKANEDLGSPYGFYGKVVQGFGRGKAHNFPTANLKTTEENQLLPKSGVYFVRVMNNGLNAYGMCNLGVRPTFEENEYAIEVHILHYGIRDLYGTTLKVEFLDRVRKEIKFPSVENLVSQLEKDKKYCLTLIGKYN